MDSGSGSVQIDIPDDTGIRVELDSGSGSFNPGNDFDLVSGESRGDGLGSLIISILGIHH